ncbi:Vegetative incompatibility protein HET-E-1 [Penicillium subrubescens]|uniref:Vegetative incompatibility protein HET-E-1 n=1 Tax=Penicillium subrubescens TaxID=1316194 RepID=A0A1Q5SP38_9EURO|nr:Vegetative incompatibility protein HET-E-1 [Penicillium subrubescens]
MASAISFGESNSGFQAGIVNGNVTAHFSKLRPITLINEQFKQWRDKRRNRLLWIRGDPGKGKTMLLCGIIDELIRSTGDNANISFFFCQATDVRINSATADLRGLVYSLVKQQLSLLSHIRKRYD